MKIIMFRLESIKNYEGVLKMTIINYDENDIVCEEIVLETNPETNKLEKICEWFFDGKTLTYIQYRNRNKSGNYYKSESKYTDCEYWKQNKTRQKLA